MCHVPDQHGLPAREMGLVCHDCILLLALSFKYPNTLFLLRPTREGNPRDFELDKSLDTPRMDESCSCLSRRTFALNKIPDFWKLTD